MQARTADQHRDENDKLESQSQVQYTEDDGGDKSHSDHLGDFLYLLIQKLGIEDSQSIANPEHALVEEDVAWEVLDIEVNHVEVEAAHRPNGAHGEQI